MADPEISGAKAHAAGDGALAASLVELGRALRARRLYASDHPLLGEMIERSRAGLAATLDHHAPLRLAVENAGFRLADGTLLDGHAQIGELARDFLARGVRALRLERELDATALRSLLDTTARTRDEIERAGGFERLLYARKSNGIVVNEAERPAESGAASSAAHDEAKGTERFQPIESAGQSQEKPDLEADAFANGSDEPRAAELLGWLRELDTCRDDARHLELARQVRQRAATLADEGARVEGYRACLVLSSHAAPRSGRSEVQKASAFDALRALATGSRLDDLIDRASAPGGAASLRAAQILLQVGSDVVSTLLRQVNATRDPDRRGQLSGIVIAIGKKATTELVRAMESADARRTRTAALFAGEIQSADCVPALQKVLRGADAEARREAAKALAKIGNPAATQVLITALASEIPDVPGIAAYCLGVTTRPEAVEALVAALRRATRDGNLDFAREAIRALGRLGQASAAPELVAILSRRTLFGGKRLADLKLAAASALARLPGDDARSALISAATSSDERVSEVARAALTRRAEPAAAG